jgi:uncharacterized protein YecT (DUF1311 family)
MRFFLLVAMVLVPCMAFAGGPVCSANWVEKIKSECSDGGTQDMTRCLGKKGQLVDDLLNKEYKNLKEDLTDPSDLIKAQRAWLAYRDSECNYQSSGYSCDSGISGMCSISTGICRMNLSCERIKLIREHIGTKCNGCPARKSDG